MVYKLYVQTCLSIFFLLIVGLNGCVKNDKKVISEGLLKNQNKIPEKTKNITSSDSQEEMVSMKLTDIFQEKAVIELSNNTDKTIYLFYDKLPIEKSVNAEVYYYSLFCKEKGKKEVWQKPDYHFLPSLEPLERGKSFRFEISPLPKINAKCKVSVLYYDDKQIVDLLDNETLDFSDEDYKNIEKAKKATKDVKFDIANKLLNKKD